MIKLQPWLALRQLFGYGPVGKSSQSLVPKGIVQQARGIYVYGKDPVSSWYRDRMQLQTDRFQNYKEYDDMDADDVVMSVLDLYAEDATQPDISTGRVIWAEAEDEDTEKMVNDTLRAVKADSEAFSVARELAKYGDCFSAVIQNCRQDGTPGEIIQLLPTPVYTCSRCEDTEGRLVGYAICPIEQLGSAIGVADPSSLSSGQPTDPPWSFVHWRLLGRDRYSQYGTSFLAGSRRPYRRLRMTEDAMVLYRLKKTPDRFVFAIKGLDGLSPEERRRAMERIRQELRKKHLLDKAQGSVRSEIEPIGMDEDLIVDESSINVTRLAGSTQINHVGDVDYLRKRVFGTWKIPPDYLGFSEAGKGVNVGESPLSRQDINFARMIKRLQYGVMEGYALACQLDMIWKGLDPSSSKCKFTLHMNPVSALDEKERLELEKVRLDTLDTLAKTGAILGIESDEWNAYLLQRSRIPVHLLRHKAPEKSGIMKGKMVVTESNERAIDKRLQEAFTHNGELAGAFVEALHKAHVVFSPECGTNMRTFHIETAICKKDVLEKVSFWQDGAHKTKMKALREDVRTKALDFSKKVKEQMAQLKEHKEEESCQILHMDLER